MDKERYDPNDLRNVIFENINERFSKGILDDIVIVVDRKTGFVNTGKLCKSAGRDLCRWIKCKRSGRVLLSIECQDDNKEFENRELSPKDKKLLLEKYTFNTTKGTRETLGTYTHPDIVIDVACWIGGKYYLWIVKIVKAHWIQVALQTQQEKYEKKIKLRDDKINALIRSVDKLNRGNKELIKNNKQLMAKIDEQTASIKELIAQNKLLLKKLEIVCNQRVIRGLPQDDHMFIIVKTNFLEDDIKHDPSKSYQYCAIRVMKRLYSRRLKELKDEYPMMEVLLEFYTPNSINLWLRVKRLLKYYGNIKAQGMYFNLVFPYPEEGLVSDIEDVHDERKEYEKILTKLEKETSDCEGSE